MKPDGKTIYAQSSDIKSRTYLEYRKDMKKKAISELEVLPWLRNKLKSKYASVVVEKSGGDSFLWFLRKGGISRDADFRARIDDKEMEIEFQYADTDIKDNYVFDFKISKVATKIKGKNSLEPKDTIFLYLFKSSPTKYAFIPAKWILDNGTKGVAPAWGNREVYKIIWSQLSKASMIEEDKSLSAVWELIDMKLFILDFQHELIDIFKEQLSHKLQKVIDKKQIIEIIPQDLNSFFEVCFVLDSINKIPQNANRWLIYLLKYVNDENTLEDISKIIYCIDFIYAKIPQLKNNEIEQLIKNLKLLLNKISKFYQPDGSYVSSSKKSPLENTRFALFSINLLEDLTQDAIYYYQVSDLKSITKIYENIPDIGKTYDFIKRAIESK
ncbi:MAG: hypothetical protein N3A62_03020 [Thermodesulfovibrionales bacterium]|nr:hypothetical protein [Thermodesulfovibrionales bacterium]